MSAVGDAANLYSTVPDGWRGDWTRDAPWQLKSANFEATYSRIKVDGRRQTVHIRIHRDHFASMRGETSVRNQLCVADHNETDPRKSKPRWRKRR
jgi:hypothetical protein